MQLKQAENTFSIINELLLNPIKFLIELRKQKMILIKRQVYIKTEVTGILKPSLEVEDNDNLNIRPALTTT